MRNALGKGLSQLIAEQADATPTEAALDQIVPNRRQPRRHFDATALQELATSIQQFGIIQPLVVRPVSEGRFEIIAGERRWRAAELAGLKTVPILVRAADQQETLELALIENVQREDIRPLECAEAYKMLIDEFGLTQEEVAMRVGKTRVAVTNTLRLLKLPAGVRKALDDELITEGHARAILQAGNEAQMLAVLDVVLKNSLSVRQTEALAKRMEATKTRRKTTVSVDPTWQSIQSGLSQRFGLPVQLKGTENKGALVIEFYSEDDLARLIDLLGFEL